ncbi:OLC1v1021516C1 [Oldenlandia corymbosa var. corymbosa]|nr:OLC1v1021516C1 [Oldenlandia corymbosa var. corymbosa]
MDLDISDFDSFSESSISEDQDDVEFMYSGHACSILSSLEETIGKIDDFLSFEREFIVGDVVCTAKDPYAQMGKVVHVDISVDLESIHGRKLHDIDSKILKRIRSVSVGDYVVSGSWVGKVQKIIDRVIVLFEDGTRSEFSTLGPEKLVPISQDLLEDSQYPFYPGQRVLVETVSDSKSTRWLCCVKNNNRTRGTVYSVDAGLVYVNWLSCQMDGLEKISSPPCLQDFKNLTLLPCPTQANWQLGDWCVIPVIDCKTVKKHGFLTAPACGIIGGEEKLEFRRQGNSAPDIQEIAAITKTKTKVDVLWQDGSHSVGLDSHSLLPVSVIDAHEFWPEQFVLEKGLNDGLMLPSVHRWGVVKLVNAKERTVKVKWSTVSVDQPTAVKLEPTEEIVSAYELVEHPDFSYSLGDAVLRLQRCCSHQNNFGTHSMSRDATGVDTDEKNKHSCKDLNALSNDFLSCIGTVTGLKDGQVEVKWASGATCKVAPYEIYQVDKCEGLSDTVTSFSQREPSSEDIMLPVTQSLEQRGKESSSAKDQNEECKKSTWSPSSSSFPQSAVGLFASISSTLFGSLGTSLFGSYRHLPEAGETTLTCSDENELELYDMHPTGSSPVVDNSEVVEEAGLGQNIKEADGKMDPAPLSSSNRPELFRQFDMVNDCSDHHFVDGAGNGTQYSQSNRVWLRKVQREWSILEKDLPETIFVRIYEENMNLLRAAIIGAPGTPYHDGLFFFDIFLPSEYPYQPPVVYYNSGGLRVNPNLYESGKVCLSLLNTWTGSGSEVWNPEKSTVLQVLLSLQALVLNEKPYFNEAGYDSQVGKAEGEKNSVSYNENAFLVSCKSMLYVLRKPPKHFEALVGEHFRQRYKSILAACKAYMDGAPVGFPFGNEKTDQIGSSTGFKIMLSKLVPILIEAFSEKGMLCNEM